MGDENPKSACGGSDSGEEPVPKTVAVGATKGDDGEIGGAEREHAIGCSRYFQDCGEASGCGSEEDFQHKRAKVLFNFEACHYVATTSGTGASASLAEGDQNLCHLSVPSENEMVLYHNLMSNDPDARKAMDSTEEVDDDGDGFNISNMEDLEVRMDLNDDLLHMVFSFLKHIDLCRAARVCRQWRSASSHEDFWRCLNFENRNISSLQFADMCHRYPNATEVNILGAPAIDVLVMEAMVSLRNIEVLILGKGQLSDAFFHAVADCHALNRLSISDASLGNGSQEVSVFHDKLRHLQIIRCHVLRISVRCPKLETLSLKRSTMVHAILTCPRLLKLDIAACHKLSDAGIRSAATSCPLLASLDMSTCSCVSDETLRDIALSCPNLRVLNASYCPNISLESVRLPMLTDLKLHNCEGITSASMASVSHSYMLEDLDLDCCGLLTSVSLDLPHLQKISLVHCRKFVDLNLRSPVLSSITVSNCPALHRINITSNSLQKLVLQKQESLTTVSLQCHSLQEVDLTECESLTNSICEVFSNGGGCRMLRSLVLDNCESLTRVEFKSSTLVSLSLVGCRAMTSLELSCPYLDQVRLDGCDHLERASFCPVGLRSLNLGICPKLSVLQIDAPYMSGLELKGCGVLSSVECSSVGLRSLNLGICPKLSVLRIDAPYMSGLELKGCGVLSQASINCPRLTSLDASFCSQLQDDCLSATATSCPLIESLILMSCTSIGLDGLSSLCRLPHLTSIDLSYTSLMNLQPVFESCLQLKVLKLQACKYLTNTSLDALYKNGALPSLRELDLSYGSICQSAIEELLACCTHLTHVSLNGCINMHDLNWGSSGGRFLELSKSDDLPSPLSLLNDHESVDQPDRLLQNLNCVGCSNIKKVVIPPAAPAARCLHLSSLNLSLSANLKEVDLACFNLNFLSLSNCCSLEILKLESPKLSCLSLQSCNIAEEVVEAAISDCNMLETLDIRFCPKIHGAGIERLRRACPSLKRIFTSLLV